MSRRTERHAAAAPAPAMAVDSDDQPTPTTPMTTTTTTAGESSQSHVPAADQHARLPSPRQPKVAHSDRASPPASSQQKRRAAPASRTSSSSSWPDDAHSHADTTDVGMTDVNVAAAVPSDAPDASATSTSSSSDRTGWPGLCEILLKKGPKYTGAVMAEKLAACVREDARQ
jgi:hypothetical protein